MLYIFYGTDEVKSRERLRATLATLEKRAPDASVTRIGEEEMEMLQIDDLLAIQGLFYNKRIVIFDKALGDKAKRERFLGHLKEVAASEHVFLVIEGAVDADLEKKLTKHATKTELFGSVKKEKKDDRDGDWTATSALERGDRHALWISLERKLAKGGAPEMVHGQLFWKAKQMVLVRGNERSRSLVGKLAELPHEARRRGVELEYALELFALSL